MLCAIPGASEVPERTSNTTDMIQTDPAIIALHQRLLDTACRQHHVSKQHGRPWALPLERHPDS